MEEARLAANTEQGWELYRQAKRSYDAEDYGQALEFCRQSWRAFGDGGKPDHLRNKYGYCIYYLELKPLKKDEEDSYEEVEETKEALGDRSVRALGAAKAICSMTSQGQFSPYTLTVLTLIQILKKNQGRWADIEAWTAELNPESLSTDPFTFTTEDGQQRKLASQLEQWYGSRVHALLETEQFKECVELADSYVQKFPTSHYDYDVWIPSWQSRALIKLNRGGEALKIAETLVGRKRNVHTLNLLSIARESAGDSSGAWKASLEAFQEDVEPKHLIKTVTQLSLLLEARDDKNELWRELVELHVRIRSTEDWRIPGTLQTQAAEALVAKSDLKSVGALKKLLGQIKLDCWNAWAEAEPRLTGTVGSPSNKSTFLRISDGRSIYCQMRALPRNARPGASVTFWVRPSFDHSKKRTSEQAVQVRLDG